MNATSSTKSHPVDHRRGQARRRQVAVAKPKSARGRTTEVRCPSCNQAYRIPAAAATSGKKIRCRRCSGLITLGPARPEPTTVHVRRDPKRRIGGPITQEPITVWHWISVLLILVIAAALIL